MGSLVFMATPRRALLRALVALVLVSSLPGCELFVRFDRMRISSDAGTDGSQMDASGDGGVDAGRDASTVPDANVDVGMDDAGGTDAFVEIDTGTDAFVPDDAGADAFVPEDGGTDAFVPVDGGTDAFVDPCTNMALDPGETDVDCGGTCPLNCSIGRTCVADADCTSAFCNATMRCALSCGNGMMDGSETDEDCGGLCTDCAVGEMCLVAGDCASGNCAASICAP
jgi:hypothetical protein